MVIDTKNNAPEEIFSQWREREAVAEEMVPIIGRLYRERDVMLSICGRPIMRASAIAILKAHRYARQVLGHELDVLDSYEILKELEKLELDSCQIDLGQLCDQMASVSSNTSSEIDTEQLRATLLAELAPVLTGKGKALEEPVDVVLYGFGRIGRLLARLLLERTGSGNKLRLRAVVLRPGKDGDLEKRASLLRRDSIHGPFSGTIRIDKENSALVANGTVIKFIYASSPTEIDYTEYGISNAIVIDNTGAWRDEEGLSQHTSCNGVSKAILTAPGKGSVKNVIFGVNHDIVESSDEILSAASCTTNAIVPALKAMDEKYGIVSGHLETVHAYTNDQNLTDNFHKKSRRGRSAPLNLVITETGAATAVAKALPQLAGKLTGNAIRVPTPNVSLAILNLELKQAASAEQINTYLREVSLHSDMRNQLDYTSSPEVVSSDIVGSDRAGIVDSQATIVNGNRCVLYVWYDNEAGYSYQVVRLAQYVGGLKLQMLPS